MRMMARFCQVDPAFAEIVEAGRYKKRSASFYLGADGQVAGLRHVGFLGAFPPDVKGLKDVQFDDAGREVTEVAFEESGMSQDNTQQIAESLFERMKAFFTPKPNEAPAATSTVEFGEGDKKVQKTPLELLVNFFESLPRLVPAGTVYTGQQPAKAGAVRNFNEGGRATVDPNSVALSDRASKIAAERKVSFGEALTIATAENPELARPGDAAAGAV